MNLLVLKILTLLPKDNCNSAPGPNFFTIFSALETLEYFLFFPNDTLLIAKIA